MNYIYKNFKIFKLDQMILTTSKDATLKVFHIKSLIETSEYNFKLARSLNEVKYLIQLSHLYYATYSNELS